MTKEERADYIKRNPRVMYLWFAGFFSLMALFFFGLAQVQDQPVYLSYDKQTRPYFWMSVMIIMTLYTLWKAWTSPKGKP